jgi:hypothetical protein
VEYAIRYWLQSKELVGYMEDAFRKTFPNGFRCEKDFIDAYHNCKNSIFYSEMYTGRDWLETLMYTKDLWLPNYLDCVRKNIPGKFSIVSVLVVLAPNVLTIYIFLLIQKWL